jgi:hypothetical protein
VGPARGQPRPGDSSLSLSIIIADRVVYQIGKYGDKLVLIVADTHMAAVWSRENLCISSTSLRFDAPKYE